MLDLAHDLRQSEMELEFLDLGGGLGISYEGGERISAAEWAAEIVPAVAQTGLKLVVEPGRFLVAQMLDRDRVAASQRRMFGVEQAQHAVQTAHRALDQRRQRIV